MRRRRWSLALVVAGVLVLLGWYIVYSQQVVTQLRKADAVQVRMYSRIYRALLDTSAVPEDRTLALLDLAAYVKNSGVPLVLTDDKGQIADTANLPFTAAFDDPQMLEYVRKLDLRNPPILEPGLGGVHYGDTAIIEGLRVVPLLQATGICLLLLIGGYALVERGRAEREKVWAGMAREAAHQLGTPLSSLAGWVEILEETADNPRSGRAVEAMQQDLVRLERVSHRFERIGRPPRSDDVDCNALVDRLATYFAARAPTLAKRVHIVSEHPDEAITVKGDAVLLEWVLEVLVKNAIDALAGADGKVRLQVLPGIERGARIRVADNGPGIPRALRRRVFDAGFSTKERGWGIGLSLARRIVEENHNGVLVLADSEHGAAFDVILSE